MRKLDCFKNVEKKKYIVWTDTGNHFRCAEFMHFLFVELAQFKIEVSFNLFCEKHGKNSRDQHFSVVSNFIQQETFVKKLTSSQDICDAIEKHQNFANIDKERVNLLQKQNTKKFEKVYTKAYVIPEHCSQQYNSLTLTVQGLRQYYNFFTDRTFRLKTHFMSDQENSTTLEPKIASEIINMGINSTRDLVEPITVQTSYLFTKMRNWKIMQRPERTQLNNSEILSDNSLNNTSINSYLFCIEYKCSRCKSNCKFRLSELNKSNSLLTQLQVNDELKAHGHPKSRKNIDRSNRTLAQAKEELKNHYLTYHSSY